jgi:voltage-gated potassium channel
MNTEKNPQKHLWRLVFIIFSIISFGTTGYYIIEDYRLLDAFYMTVITITTVGFQEVKPLDDAGKIFTAVLLFTSFGFFAYSISIMTSLVLDGKLFAYYRGIRYKKEIKKMKKHTIVVGYGRNGKQAVQELNLHNEPIIIIESSPILHETFSNNIKWIVGDATTDDTLLEAGIKEAKAIINALPNDADNLYISISAKILNPDINIISRASSESAERKLHAVGANHVIMPEKVGGIYMAGFVAQADLTEFLNHLRIDHYNPGILTEIDCKLINSSHSAKTVEGLLSNFNEINVLGVKLKNNDFVIAPIRTLTIAEINKIFVMGIKEEIELMKKALV